MNRKDTTLTQETQQLLALVMTKRKNKSKLHIYPTYTTPTHQPHHTR